MPLTYFAFMTPATSEGVAMLPLISGSSFPADHSTTFGTTIYMGNFFHHFKGGWDEFQSFYDFFCDDFILCSTVRTIAVFAGQFIFDCFCHFEIRKIFFFFAGAFFRLCDGITISSSISAVSVSALASASLNRSICSYPSAYFHWKNRNVFFVQVQDGLKALRS